MPIKRRVVGIENPRALLFQVVELAALHGPGEHAEDREHEQRADRHEQIEDVHDRQRARRSELSTTNSELAAMPSPAAQGGSAPSSASGTQAAL